MCTTVSLVMGWLCFLIRYGIFVFSFAVITEDGFELAYQVRIYANYTSNSKLHEQYNKTSISFAGFVSPLLILLRFILCVVEALI